MVKKNIRKEIYTHFSLFFGDFAAQLPFHTPIQVLISLMFTAKPLMLPTSYLG